MLTYRELNGKANQYAHFLLSKHVGQGDVVAVCIESRPELLTLYCACAKIGAICAMVNTNQRGESLVHSFNINKGKVIVIGEECLDFFKEAKADKTSRIVLYAMEDTGPSMGAGWRRYRPLPRHADQQPRHNRSGAHQIPSRVCLHVGHDRTPQGGGDHQQADHKRTVLVGQGGEHDMSGRHGVRAPAFLPHQCAHRGLACCTL
jgi:acyl-CoA synthetase (AMP-forming)/AMP-acid ligase II